MVTGWGQRRLGAMMTALAVFLGAGSAIDWSDPAGAESVAIDGGQMKLLTVHPWAVSQPTASGKRLVDLEIHNGKVWAGYGDYSNNTGPITMAAYDPTGDGEFHGEFTLDTEAVFNIRSTADAVIAPATDPRKGADFAIGQPWWQARPLGATHVYDSASMTGDDLWMVGSKGRDAVGWRSLDDGKTWTEMLRVAPDATAPSDDFMRFYFAGVVDGHLYVQAVGSVSRATPASLVYDGTWSSGPNLLPQGGFGWEPTPYRDGFVYHSSGHGYIGQILYFDGTATSVVRENAFDLAVANDEVWVLETSGIVSRSSDLSHWSVELQGPTNAVSVAVDDMQVYVGGADSALWSAPTAREAPTQDPTPNPDDSEAAPSQNGTSEKPNRSENRGHTAVALGRGTTPDWLDGRPVPGRKAEAHAKHRRSQHWSVMRSG